MEALSAPVGGRQQRRLHLAPVGHARLPVLVGVELAGDAVLVEVAAILPEHLVRQGLGPRHPVAGHAALEPAGAAAVLHGIDLRLRPVLHEAAAEDAAVVRHVAVEIRGAFPGADGGQMLGLQRRRLPLVLGIVGDAVEADLAVRPGLHARPVDALRKILCLAQRPDVDDAGRAPRAAAVDPDADVPVGHPFLRIDDLPALILVGRAGRHVGLVGAHAPPLVGVEVLEVQPLAVGPIGHDHRIFAVGDRPVDVASQHQAVVHRDRHVPIDSHPIADLALLAVVHACPRRSVLLQLVVRRPRGRRDLGARYGGARRRPSAPNR